MEWIRYKLAQGVRYREHATRPADPSKPKGKQKDRYWQIFYKYQGKSKAEILGWESEGWTESAVSELSAKLSGNRAKGIAPGTFAELRAVNSEQQEEKKAQIKAAQEIEEQE